MLDMNFKPNSYEKTDPTDQATSSLLNEGFVKNPNSKENTINASAKRKTSSFSIVCYNISTYLLLICGTIFIVIGVLLVRWPLFDLIAKNRLEMWPSLPPFKLWAVPEPVIYCRVYIFTVVNPETFLNGTDKKLKMKEVGPIVFREHMEHNNIVFHDNSTISYTARRYLEFLPELNEPGILDRNILVPNIVLLGMAARLADFMFTMKMGFNIISREDKVFVNKTVNEFLWNFTTPALLTVDKYLPFMVPMDNGGALYSIYKGFEDRVNVRIGPKYNAQEFFTINTFGYRPTVPGFRPEHGDCYADLNNSTEGALYPNSVEKDVILFYWRKTVCRPIALHFEEEVMVGSLRGYKYITHTDWYDRRDNLTSDCYKGFGSKPLANGLSDISKCFGGIHMAVSSPHFYGRSGYWEEKLEGFTPTQEEHGSYAIIEPINGVPLDQKARSQSNMIMPRLTGFNRDINQFSGMVVPFLWLEYHQPKLTPAITNLLIFTSNVLPYLQYVIPVILLVLGLVMYYLVIRRVNTNPSLGGYSKVKMFWRREKAYFFESKH